VYAIIYRSAIANGSVNTIYRSTIATVQVDAICVYLLLLLFRWMLYIDLLLLCIDLPLLCIDLLLLLFRWALSFGLLDSVFQRSQHINTWRHSHWSHCHSDCTSYRSCQSWPSHCCLPRWQLLHNISFWQRVP